MITAFRYKVTVGPDGRIEIDAPELKPGAKAEMIVLVETRKLKQAGHRQVITAADLLASGLVGLWSGRKEIGDSLEFAQQLRHAAEHREMKQ
jgi:hypothetical protein